MKKYDVVVDVTVSNTFKIEAENEDDAGRKMMDMLDETPRSELRDHMRDWRISDMSIAEILEGVDEDA